MIAGDLSRTCCHGTLESFQVSCGSLDCLWFTGTNSSYINEQASSLFLVHFSSLLRLAPAVSPPRPRFSAPLAAPTNASYINVQRSLCYSVTTETDTFDYRNWRRNACLQRHAPAALASSAALVRFRVPVLSLQTWARRFEG